MNDPSPALAGALVVVAHSDDDGLGLAAALWAHAPAAIAYLTDSAPRDARWFTTPHASRTAYAAARRHETRAAAALFGVAADRLCFLDAVDMEAHHELPRLDRALAGVADMVRPTAVWSPAYEGGHPDHDCAAFLAARLARRRRVPHFEFALYRYEGGFTPFTFGGDDPGFLHRLSADEVAWKQRVRAAYVSQAPMIAQLRCDLERYRRAPAYDFQRRPVAGPTGYEVWGWAVAPADLCDAFAALEARDPVLVSSDGVGAAAR